MDYQNDWTSKTTLRREQRTNTRTGNLPGSRVVYCTTGRRQRIGKTSNPEVIPGLKRCSSYTRHSKTVNLFTATRRTLPNGDRVSIYPERFPFMSDDGNLAPNSFWTNSINRCDTEAMLRIVEAKAQAANDLLEAKKSLDLLCNAAKTGAQTLLALRRGEWKSAFRHLLGPGNHSVPRKIGDRWLQFAYGWRPLASSIHAYQELLKGHTDKHMAIRAVREVKETFTRTYQGESSTGYYSNANGSISGQHSVKTILYAKVSNEKAKLAREWGVDSPASILWEAMPYSFVVDWFMPVGNVISAWSARTGVSFLTGCRITRVTAKGRIRLTAISVDNSWNAGSLDSQSEAELEMHRLERTRLTAFPYPGLYIKNPFSTEHVASALALIMQLR